MELTRLIHDYGAAAITGPVLLLFLWFVRTLIKRLFKMLDEFSGFMKAQTEALTGIRTNCMVCRADSIGSLRDAEAGFKAELARVVWEANKETAATLKGVLEAVKDVHRTLDVTERDRLRDELSRPHLVTPPPQVVR